MGGLHPGELPSPHGLLEAGGAGSRPLLAAITRRVAEMSPGQILEVSSASETATVDAITWCHATGHELCALLSEAAGTRFWIKKCETHDGEQHQKGKAEMTTGEILPLSEQQFRTLVNKLAQASQSLSERERAFVVETFKEGVASDEDDAQGYVQMVEGVAGDITPVAEPLGPEERRVLGERLAQIGEELTPEERAYVQSVFARGTLSLDEVQGYGLFSCYIVPEGSSQEFVGIVSTETGNPLWDYAAQTQTY